MPMPWKLRLFWYRLDKAALAAALFFALVVGALMFAAGAVFNQRDAQREARRGVRAPGLVQGTRARGAHRPPRFLPLAPPPRGWGEEAHAGFELLVDQVMRAFHAGGAVGRLRAPIRPLDVQAEAAHRALLCGEPLKV